MIWSYKVCCGSGSGQRVEGAAGCKRVRTKLSHGALATRLIGRVHGRDADGLHRLDAPGVVAGVGMVVV